MQHVTQLFTHRPSDQGTTWVDRASRAAARFIAAAKTVGNSGAGVLVTSLLFQNMGRAYATPQRTSALATRDMAQCPAVGDGLAATYSDATQGSLADLDAASGDAQRANTNLDSAITTLVREGRDFMPTVDTAYREEMGLLMARVDDQLGRLDDRVRGEVTEAENNLEDLVTDEETGLNQAMTAAASAVKTGATNAKGNCDGNANFGGPEEELEPLCNAMGQLAGDMDSVVAGARQDAIDAADISEAASTARENLGLIVAQHKPDIRAAAAAVNGTLTEAGGDFDISETTDRLFDRNDQAGTDLAQFREQSAAQGAGIVAEGESVRRTTTEHCSQLDNLKTVAEGEMQSACDVGDSNDDAFERLDNVEFRIGLPAALFLTIGGPAIGFLIYNYAVRRPQHQKNNVQTAIDFLNSVGLELSKEARATATASRDDLKTLKHNLQHPTQFVESAAVLVGLVEDGDILSPEAMVDLVICEHPFFVYQRFNEFRELVPNEVVIPPTTAHLRQALDFVVALTQNTVFNDGTPVNVREAAQAFLGVTAINNLEGLTLGRFRELKEHLFWHFVGALPAETKVQILAQLSGNDNGTVNWQNILTQTGQTNQTRHEFATRVIGRVPEAQIDQLAQKIDQGARTRLGTLTHHSQGGNRTIILPPFSPNSLMHLIWAHSGIGANVDEIAVPIRREYFSACEQLRLHAAAQDGGGEAGQAIADPAKVAFLTTFKERVEQFFSVNPNTNPDILVRKATEALVNGSALTNNDFLQIVAQAIRVPISILSRQLDTPAEITQLADKQPVAIQGVRDAIVGQVRVQAGNLATAQRNYLHELFNNVPAATTFIDHILRHQQEVNRLNQQIRDLPTTDPQVAELTQQVHTARAQVTHNRDGLAAVGGIPDIADKLGELDQVIQNLADEPTNPLVVMRNQSRHIVKRGPITVQSKNVVYFVGLGPDGDQA